MRYGVSRVSRLQRKKVRSPPDTNVAQLWRFCEVLLNRLEVEFVRLVLHRGVTYAAFSMSQRSSWLFGRRDLFCRGTLG